MLPENENSFQNLFGDIRPENLKSIFIFGKEFQVPNNINLLRAFHYITKFYDEYEIKLEKHCWGGTCENCKSVFEDNQLGTAEGLACQMDVEEYLQIKKIPRTMKKKIPHGED
jgi:hypothetical protein